MLRDSKSHAEVALTTVVQIGESFSLDSPAAWLKLFFPQNKTQMFRLSKSGAKCVIEQPVYSQNRFTTYKKIQ